MWAVGALCADPLHVLEVDAALSTGERCLHGVAGDAKFGGAGLVQHCDCHPQCRDAQQGSEQQEPEPGLSNIFPSMVAVSFESDITNIVVVLRLERLTSVMVYILRWCTLWI